MENNIENNEEVKRNYESSSSTRFPIAIAVILAIIFFILFMVFIIGANTYPLTSNGKEATRAILNFVALFFLALFFVSILLASIKGRKDHYYATIEEKKFNVVIASTDQEENNAFLEEVEKKSKHNVSNLNELYQYFNEYASSYGITSDSLAPLLASIFYSRLTAIKTNEDNLINTFTSFFGDDPIYIDYSAQEADLITEHRDFIEACSLARSNDDSPTFVVIRNALLNEMKGFLGPVYKAIVSPNEKFSFVFNGDTIVLPKNLNIILLLNENDQIFDLDKSLLEYTSYFEPSYEEVNLTDSCLPVNVNSNFLKSILKDAKQNYSINEDSWKRVDAVIDAACANTNFSINNKSYLKVENFCFSLFLFLNDDFKAIDETLSNVVLISVLSHWDEEAFNSNKNVEKLFINNLGTKAPKTMLRMKNFRKLFDEKGNRL